MWLLLITGGLAGQPQPPSAHPRLLAWVPEEARERPGLGDLLADLGCRGVNLGGGDGPEAAASLGLPVWVDPLLPRGILHLDASTYEKALERSLEEPPDCARPVCLDDPAVRARVARLVARRLQPFAEDPPLFVSLGDEVSFTRLINPADWCGAPATLAHLPAFLVQRWGSPRAALEAWGHPGPDLQTLRLQGTAAARRHFFGDAPSPGALVPWNDARAFADARFAAFLAFVRKEVQRHLPGVPVGFLGGQMPSAFGGFDWRRLLAAADVVEAYDYGGAAALVDGLRSLRSRRLATVHLDRRGPGGIKARAHRLHAAWLQGAGELVLFPATALAAPGTAHAEPSSLARALRPHLQLIRGPAARSWAAGRPFEPRIAVLHNMAGVRLQWMRDTAADGASWTHRRTSHQLRHGTLGRTRAAWVSLLRDLGFEGTFITSRTLAGGGLEERGFRVLVLPRSAALSAGEVQGVRGFLRAGGLVIADVAPGDYTARLQKRPRGALDAVFGVRRDGARRGLHGEQVIAPRAPGIPYPVAEPGLRATEASPSGTVAGTPVVLAHRHGSGRTLLLNLLVLDYARHRLHAPHRAAWLQRTVLRHLVLAGIRPHVHTRRAEGDELPWPVWAGVRHSPGGLVVALRAGLAAGAGSVVPWAHLAPHTTEVRVRLWDAFHVQDSTHGTDLGRRRTARVPVHLDRPTLLLLSPVDNFPK